MARPGVEAPAWLVPLTVAGRAQPALIADRFPVCAGAFEDSGN